MSTDARDRWLVYVGTYTNRNSRGIYSLKMDRSTGALTRPEVAAEASNPAFVRPGPGGTRLYAAADSAEGDSSGEILAFSVDRPSGALRPLGRRTSPGDSACYLAMDGAGKVVLAANYTSGSVTVCPVLGDGSLGELTQTLRHEGSSVNPDRQEAPHPHSINLDAAGRFAYSPDLGADKIYIYRLDAASATLSPALTPWVHSSAAGAGPRHFAIHPGGEFAYVINELASTITAYDLDSATGALSEIETVSTLPDGYGEVNYTADVYVLPSGKFIYGSNRGNDSIAIFAIDGDTGRLSLVGREPTQGKTPRGFAISPGGEFLVAANEDSDTLVVFRIDQATGELSPPGDVAEVPEPTCVALI